MAVKKHKNEVPVSKDDLEDFIWMSYRYCIGRHTIASHMHASTILKYIGHMSEERQQFAVTDIRKDISHIIHFENNVYVDGYCEAGDAISILIKFMIENNISLKECDVLKHNKIKINTTTGVVSVEPIPEEEYENTDKYKYSFIQNTINDVIVWIKLCNYLDKRSHKFIEYNGERMEVFPFPDINQYGVPEILWTTIDSYKDHPHITQYIAPEYIKFVD